MTRRVCSVLSVLVAVCVGGVAFAQGLGDLSGTADVSAVQAEVNSEDQETIRQLYTVHFERSVTDYIDVRSSFRYFDFDVEGSQEFGTFREEYQPSAELSWSHPLFRFSALGSRRVARSPVTDGELINESLSFDWRSRIDDWPVFTLRYDLQEIKDTGSSSSRDVRDGRFLGSVDYDRKNETLQYVFTRRDSRNFVRGVASDENTHLFRYLGSHVVPERPNWRVTSHYVYSRSDRVDEVLTGRSFYEKVHGTRGLYLHDSTPTQDELNEVPALIDGNTVTPVSPLIGIGAGETDRNIGIDLGIARDRVGALYVYTDRISALALDWDVYISDDNLNWSLHTASPVAAFSVILQRYEIEFPGVRTRYVKVVNSGANTVSGVLVTEVEVLESIDIKDERDESSSSHLADVRVDWTASEQWQMTLDMVARLDPGSGSVPSRQDLDYGIRTRYLQRDDLSHVFRAQQSWRNFETGRGDLRDDLAAYTLLYDPLPTLSSSASVGWRMAHEGAQRTIETRSAVIEANATPLPAVRIATEATASHVEQPVAHISNDLWSVRNSVSTDITRSVSADLGWGHQQTRSQPSDHLRVRRNYDAGATLQLTSAIFARATLSWVQDERFNRSQDYLISWRMFSRLLASGQAVFETGAGDFGAERFIVNATLDLGKRTVLYVRYFDVDQRGAGGTRTVSWQQGLRTSF